ncbi:phage tail tape measure protein [uncultured Bacteroides sp.]|uniref:phage tail tape measure protein n=1 Tax=uncultured Bacteroides sp. TaxID=162156 RepID=UPI0025974BDF|nr:phage tail tape measure protein [uncultured Bacteroides sp.]
MSLKIDRVQLEIVIQQDQARQKMIELEDSLKKANSELRKIKKSSGENSDEYKKQVEVIKQLKQQYDDLYDEIGLTNLSLRDLGKRQKELNQILRNLSPNTDLYKQYSEQLKVVNNRIKELKGTANETRFSIAKLADGFNRYGTMAATAVASLTGLTLTMRKCVDDYAEMEEAQSQVIKYTGLSKEAVKELNEEFKNMDTRTPRTRLNELAGDAGKLGISTKEGVLEFVEAANMINVALGEDLGKDAISQIGKLAGMFGEGDRSLKENMLAVGSAVNSVAQNSAASEPYLVEFTARMGGVGKQAKLAVTDIMGYASALDQNMLRSEMASTALQGLILKLYQEPAQYAKLAGIEVGAFTKMMEEDANEAVLTFLEALGRLGGMDQMAPVLKEMKLSGAEAAGVIAALAGNVEKVRKEQEGANQAYMEATSVVNEYNVQNSTVQAELDKAKQRFADIRVELGQQLLPVMKYMITTGSLTVKGLSAVVHVLLEYKDIILTAVTAITTYTFTVNAASLVTKSFAAITKVSANAVALLNKVTKVSPWGLVISGLTSVIAYLTIYKDKVDDSKISLEAMNNISSKTDSEFSKQASKIDRLTDIINDNRLSIDQRRKAINDLKSIIPDYNAKLSEEGIIISQNTDAIQTYLAQLEKQIKLKAAQEELEELYRQKRKNDIEINRLAAEEEVKRNKLNAAQNAATLSSSSMTTSGTKALSSGLNVSVQSLQSQHRKVQDLLEESRNKAIQLNNAIKLLNDEIASSDIADKVNSINESNNIFTDPQLGDGNSEAKDKLAELEKSLRQEQNLIKKQYQTGEIDEENYQSKLYQIQVKYIGLKIELLKKYGEDTSSAEGQLLDLMISEANKNYQKELATKKENLDNEVKAEEIGYSRKQLALKNHYADSLISKEEYDKRLEQLEIQHLEQLRRIRQSYGEDTGDIDATLADKGVKKREQGDKQKVDSGLKGIDLAKSEENALQILDSMYEAGLISYEQYEQQKTAITEKWENERNNIRKNAFNTAMNLISSVSDLMSAMQDSEISSVERKYDKQIQAAEKAGKDTTKLEEEKEAAVMEVKKKYADKQFALNILEVASKTALAIMAAWTAGPILGPILGAIAAAQGAAQIAIAKQQRDEAKGLYTGGYSQDYVEGYTKKGNSKDVAGVIPVHKNEFVTNHEGVANPHVKQFLDVFDVAQKNGTIGMINTTQILEQIRTKSGRYSGGYTSNSSVSGSQSNYSSGDVHSMLNVIIQLLRKSNENLSTIAAKKLTVDVRSVRDGIKRIETLERNASR